MHQVNLTGLPAFLIILVILFIVFGIPIIIVVKIFRMLTRKRREAGNLNSVRGQTIVPQYEPPLDLTAAELGLLVDNKVGRLELLGTIYQLKVRKIISLERNEQGQVNMRLLAYPPDLLPFENLLIKYFFHASTSVWLSNFFRQADFSVMQGYFNYLVMQSVQAKKLAFYSEGFDTQPYTTYLQSLGNNPLKIVTEIYKYLAQHHLTREGTARLPELAGFKLYIDTAELDKIKFHAQGDLQQYIEELTPYAITFNQMERWQLVGIPLFTVLDPNSVPELNQALYEQDYFNYCARQVAEIDAYTVSTP